MHRDTDHLCRIRLYHMLYTSCATSFAFSKAYQPCRVMSTSKQHFADNVAWHLQG